MFLLNHLLAGDSQKRSGQDSVPTPFFAHPSHIGEELSDE